VETVSFEREDTPYLVPALDRSLQILELLKSQDREMNMSEIAALTGWPKSSVQKLLITLHHYGFVHRDEGTKMYSLGLALAEFGRAALSSLDIRKMAKPLLKEMVDYSGETAVLGILQGTKMVMVDKQLPFQKIRVSPFIGLRLPGTQTAMSKAILAWLPSEKVDEIIRVEGFLRRGPNAISDPDAYRRELQATRARGYAVEWEEFQEGANGVAAPVFSPNRDPVAVLGITGPSFRMPEEKVADCAAKCVEAAAELSRMLSGRRGG
jgi:DNA-binding IclR family transcriptional regulator